jgi:CheY-like chemotaxis protein
MPELDGFDAASQIRALMPKTILVGHTGLPPARAMAGERALFDHYVLEPADVNEILVLIESRLCGPAADLQSHALPSSQTQRANV